MERPDGGDSGIKINGNNNSEAKPLANIIQDTELDDAINAMEKSAERNHEPGQHI